MMLRPRYRGDATLRFRLVLHLTVFAGYLSGGLIGGLTSMHFGLRALYLAAAVLSLVLLTRFGGAPAPGGVRPLAESKHRRPDPQSRNHVAALKRSTRGLHTTSA